MNNLLIILLSTLTWSWWPTGITQDTRQDSLLYTVGIDIQSGSGTQTAYWLAAGQDGEIGSYPHAGHLRAGIVKPAGNPHRWFDYDGAIVLSGRFSRPTTGYFSRLYGHVRLYIFDLTVGITPYSFVVPDDDLSSGGLLFSRNAHPMPRISFGIDRYTAIPGLFGYAEVRAGITHMWQNDTTYIRRGKVHHKYIGVRLGGNLPVNIRYEFHHAAQWGGYSPVYGDLGNNWNSFLTILLARQGESSIFNEKYNVQGNHISHQLLQVDAKGEGWIVSAYWQNIQEDGPISLIGTTMNVRDGLWGLHVQQDRWPFINRLTYEFVNSADQSGPYHDKDGFIYGGNDSYYENGVYQNGWTYWHRAIGNEWILRSSRMMGHYLGIGGDIFGYKYKLVGSYTRNYYKNATAHQPIDRCGGWLIEVQKHSDRAWGLDFGIRMAGDVGSPAGSPFGAMLTISKTGIIKEY